MNIKKSKLPIGSKVNSQKTTRQVISLLSGNGGNGGNVSNAIKEEVKLKLLDKGLTIDKIIDKYKEVVELSNVKYKGSDVLNVLKRLEELHGLITTSGNIGNSGNDNITMMFQNKSIDEIKTFVMSISGKTEEYIKRLEDNKDNK